MKQTNKQKERNGKKSKKGNENMMATNDKPPTTWVHSPISTDGLKKQCSKW